MKAFPQKYPQDSLRACFELNPIESGMDLRDYFAAKAMQAVAVIHSHERDVARNAYKIADAMMEARK
jgi:hypothetical protein